MARFAFYAHMLNCVVGQALSLDDDEVTMLQVTVTRAQKNSDQDSGHLFSGEQAGLQQNLQRVTDIAVDVSAQTHDAGLIGHDFTAFWTKINAPFGIQSFQAVIDHMDADFAHVDAQTGPLLQVAAANSTLQLMTVNAISAVKEECRQLGKLFKDIDMLHESLTASLLYKLGLTSAVVDLVTTIQSWKNCFAQVSTETLEASLLENADHADVSLVQIKQQQQQLSASTTAAVQQHLLVLGDMLLSVNHCWCATGNSCNSLVDEYDSHVILGHLSAKVQPICVDVSGHCQADTHP